MLLFNSIVFGAFTGGLVDYWLGRAVVRDSRRLIFSVVAGVVVAFLVGFGKVQYF